MPELDELLLDVVPPKSEDKNYIDEDAPESEKDSVDVPFVFDEESRNLVPDFEAHPEAKMFLKKLVQDCYEEFKQSWDKNKNYREKTALSWKLLYCDLPPKQMPFEGCANAAIPLMLQNVVRYTNKIQQEVFGDWSAPFNFIPTNPNAELIAPIVSEHSNWQVRNRITGFDRQMARAVLVFAVAGDVVCHSYYDEVTKRNVHEILTCDDFVTPYTHVSVAPDFSDVPWVARRLPMFKTKLKQMRKKWSNVEEVIKHEAPEYGDTQAETEVRQSIAEHLGEDPFGQKKGEYEIIHYEGWLKLLGMEEERYCQLIFDMTTLAPLKLTIHESADYAERYRFKYQQQEAQEYAMAMQQYQAQYQERQMQVDALLASAVAAPVGHPMGHQMGDMARATLQQPPSPPPVKPSWAEESEDPMVMPQPAPLRKTPIYMFSHGVCLEPILGNIGIGIGRIDAQLNLATNTIWSQSLDAATLGNGKTFITAGNIDFKAPFKVGPGQINKAKNVMPSDLQNAFITLDFGGANPQLMAMANSLMVFGEQASSTPDVMSGAAGKSGETARGIQARIDQMNSMFAVPTQRFAKFVIQIMKNNCKLNRVWMGDEEIFYVNKFNEDMEMGGSEMIKAAREFYDNEFEIELTAGLQFKSSAQKMSEADEILQLPNAMPELQMNFAFKYAAMKQSLEARGMRKMARKLLGPPPPLPTTTFGLPFGTPGTTATDPATGQQIPFPQMPPQPMVGPPPGGDPNQPPPEQQGSQ